MGVCSGTGDWPDLAYDCVYWCGTGCGMVD